jgi:hypothetical protein
MELRLIDLSGHYAGFHDTAAFSHQSLLENSNVWCFLDMDAVFWRIAMALASSHPQHKIPRCQVMGGNNFQKTMYFCILAPIAKTAREMSA